MKILVTGSAGFLGSNLVKRLTKDGHKVIGWDIKTGHDVCDSSLSLRGVGAIFHLACPVNPADYRSVALKTVLTSCLGTDNMLKLAKKNKAKFLYVSSSEVYGEDKPPFSEDDLVILDPLGERSFYDSSKLTGEILTMIYHRYDNLDTRIVRPFNIYGPGMRDDDTRVIPSFMRNIRQGRSVQITGKGLSKRTFCFIDDFIEGLIRAMFYERTNGQVFNLGTKELVTIKQLARLIKAKIEYIPERVAEQKNRLPDITKAKKILNWQPETSLKKGLKLTWQSYL